MSRELQRSGARVTGVSSGPGLATEDRFAADGADDDTAGTEWFVDGGVGQL